MRFAAQDGDYSGERQHCTKRTYLAAMLVEMIHTASPLTYRDYTSTPEGSAYGLVKDCRNPLASLVFARTKISNLLITGQSLNIHGCLGATISSAVTCSEILGEEYLAKKIGNA